MKLSGSSPGTRLSLLLCVVASQGLSGCVTRVVCQMPPPPAVLMEPPPEESFLDRLDAILDRSFTASPETPTN